MHNRTPKREHSCASCGDALDPARIYVGFIGTLNLCVCEPCACWHSSGQFVLYTIAQAQQIIRETHARLNAYAAIAAR